MQDPAIASAIHSVARKTKLLNYRIKIVGQSGQEDGYGSNLEFIRVEGKTENEEEIILELAVKYTKKSEILVNIMQGVFDKEIYIYTKVKTAFEQLLQEHKVEYSINFLSVCHHTVSESQKQALIFENLKSQNFKLLDSSKQWPWKATILALEAYGKWHGFAFALRTLKPNTFQDLIENNINMFSKVYSELKFIKSAAEEFIKARNKIIAEKTESIVSDILNYTEEDVRYAITNMFFEKECLEKGVILHGDCWSNNYLFKFQDNSETPTDIRLIDWQISGLASPIFDLSCHIFSTANTEESSDITTYLDVYYKSFSKTLSSFGCEANDLFSYSELLDHWKKFSRFGLFLGCFLIKFSSPRKKINVDFQKLTKEEQLDYIFNYEVANEDLFYRRCKSNLLFYCNNIKCQ